MAEIRDKQKNINALAAMAVVLIMVAILLWTICFYGGLERQVPADDDWTKAASIIREGFAPGDMVAIVPFWATTGERAFVEAGLPYRYVRRVAQEDWPGASRLWVVSGYNRFEDRESLVAAGAESQDMQQAGELSIERFALPGPHDPVFDFRANLEKAEVLLAQGKGSKRCDQWEADTERFVCVPGTTWQYVGRLTQEIGDGVRPTIWAHPIRNTELRIRYYHVPASRRIVVHTGLSGYALADPFGAPVFMDVIIDGKKAARLTQPNEWGWRRHEIALDQTTIGDHSVEFVVTTERDGRRHFTFNAYAQ